MSIQSCDQILIGLSEWINGFKEKLKLWKKKGTERQVASFSTLNLLLKDENFHFTDIKNVIVKDLGKPIMEFVHYIPQGDTVK
jgi:hypothetical protein